MSAEHSDGDGNAKADNDSPQSALQRGETNSQPTENKQNNPEKLPMWKNPQWWQVLVQAVLIPAGIYALVIYSEQLDQMQESTKAATDAIKLARDNAHLDQRAWIAPTTVSGKPAELNKPFEIQMQIKNTGKTFA